MFELQSINFFDDNTIGHAVNIMSHNNHASKFEVVFNLDENSEWNFHYENNVCLDHDERVAFEEWFRYFIVPPEKSRVKRLTKTINFPDGIKNRRLFSMMNEHTLVLGPSKAAKTKILSGTEKALIKEENIVIVNPEGELSKAVEMTLKEKGYKICIFDFAEKDSYHYNPLLLNTSYDNGYLAKMITPLCCDNNLVDQEFWIGAIDANLEGVMNYVQIKYADDPSKWTFTTAKEVLWGALQDENSEYLRKTPIIYTLAPKTRTSVLSDTINIMDLFNKEPLSDILSDNDTIFNEIIRETDGSATIEDEPKYAIVIKFSPDNKMERALCNSLVSRLLAIFCDNKQRTIRKRTTHFFINDAAKLGKILKMNRYITVARSYNIHIDLSFENIEQLEGMYGHVHTEVIKSNTNIIKTR